MKTLWESTAGEIRKYPVLDQELQADVCVIGGGITGITAALQLAIAGKKVVLLEAEQLASGTTGYSSNHLNTQIDFSYRQVEKNFNRDIAGIVARSRMAAIDYIERNVREFDIDCDFKRLDGFLYSEREDELKILDQEYEASLRAGLEVSKTLDTSLPFPVKLAVKYHNQAAFHSIKYIAGIARHLEQLNVKIFENSRVIDYTKTSSVVKTAAGSVQATNIIMATHIPLFINLHQTTSTPYRSYMISLDVEEFPRDALYWDMYDPYHYTRIYEQDGKKFLAIGGADHKTGHGERKRDYYKDLEAYASLRYKVRGVSHRWGHQFYEPSDGLPYIGLSPMGSAFMATGFSGDGLVYGTVAGIILSDLITGMPNEWVKAYDSRRFKPVASAEDFLKHNIDVAKNLIADRFSSDDLKNLQPGQGIVVRVKGENYAICKDHNGEISATSAVCTHMGCIVNWNNMGKNWECACHGSQFEPSGKVILGPAVTDLDKVDEMTIKAIVNTEKKHY
jgi:glycine/D-amino acid oxidase-like deaminating enzyme/nitrite reductase/ring-hydroxylating ferredoxin subunit